MIKVDARGSKDSEAILTDTRGHEVDIDSGYLNDKLLSS